MISWLTGLGILAVMVLVCLVREKKPDTPQQAIERAQRFDDTQW